MSLINSQIGKRYIDTIFFGLNSEGEKEKLRKRKSPTTRVHTCIKNTRYAPINSHNISRFSCICSVVRSAIIFLNASSISRKVPDYFLNFRVCNFPLFVFVCGIEYGVHSQEREDRLGNYLKVNYVLISIVQYDTINAQVSDVIQHPAVHTRNFCERTTAPTPFALLALSSFEKP